MQLGGGGETELRAAAGVDGKLGAPQGQRRPNAYSSAPKVFSLYEYLESEYDGARDESAARAAKARAARVDSSADFKVTALPPIPKGAGSFNEFEYTIDPFELKDEKAKADKAAAAALIKHGPILAGGHQRRSGEMTKMRASEAVHSLGATLAADWPRAFAGAFLNAEGCVVCAFDRAAMAAGGDVTTYMNNLFRTNETVRSFNLRKDVAHWGVDAGMDAELGRAAVYYVLMAQWAHARHISGGGGGGYSPRKKGYNAGGRYSSHLQGKAASAGEHPAPSLESGRVPFPDQTSAGMPLQTNVRIFSRSFRY